MAFDDIRQWITALDKAGELKRIRVEVDPILEITEIADRVSKGAAKKYGRPGGPALLFENVKGGNGVPVLINQFGSERRMQMALGVDSSGRNCRTHPPALEHEVAGRLSGKAEDAAHARGYGQVLSQSSPHRSMQRSY